MEKIRTNLIDSKVLGMIQYRENELLVTINFTDKWVEPQNEIKTLTFVVWQISSFNVPYVMAHLVKNNGKLGS